jgi:hypothetical protein
MAAKARKSTPNKLLAFLFITIIIKNSLKI